MPVGRADSDRIEKVIVSETRNLAGKPARLRYRT